MFFAEDYPATTGKSPKSFQCNTNDGFIRIVGLIKMMNPNCSNMPLWKVTHITFTTATVRRPVGGHVLLLEEK